VTLAEEKKVIGKASVLTMIMNGFLAVIKILAGIFGKSSALISDAINSISDVLSNLMVMIFGRFSRKEKDAGHPYGHEKFDSMVSVFVGFFIIVTAYEIGKSAVNSLYGYFAEGTPIETPKLAALIVAFSTIVIKELMYRFTKKSSKKANSQALKAIAYDNRSDELASFGALLGIGGAMFGLLYLEPIASLVICLFVARVGFKAIKDGTSQVVDQAADQATIDRIMAAAEEIKEIKRIDDLKTRMFGMKLYVDIEISVDRNLPLWKAHAIAQELHDRLEKQFPNIKHCMVHENPYDETSEEPE